MSECRLCDFKKVDDEEHDDGLGAYFEGEHIDLGNFDMHIYRFEHGATAWMSVTVEDEWNETVKYSIGGCEGEIVVPTDYENTELVDISYCPMCGRKLDI